MAIPPAPARARTLLVRDALPVLMLLAAGVGVDRLRDRPIDWVEPACSAAALVLGLGYRARRTKQVAAAAARGDYGPEVYGGRLARWLDSPWGLVPLLLLAFVLGSIVSAWIASLWA